MLPEKLDETFEIGVRLVEEIEKARKEVSRIF